MVLSTSEQQFSFREEWLKNGSVRLHYVESGWDSPARYPKFSAGWAERWSSEPSIKDNPDRMRGMRGLERESTEVLLWDKLDAIESPILLIGGCAEGALLKPEHVEKYRQHCRNLE